MELKWNLNDLFNSNESFYEEIDKINKLVIEIKKYDDVELDKDKLLDMLDKKWHIKELTNNVLVYGSLMYYKNIKSEECIKLKTDAENFSNKVNLELSFIDRKVISLGKHKVDEFINTNEKLEVYKQYLNNLFRMQEHVQDDNTNKKVSNNVDSINNQLKLYNNLLRDIKYGEVEIDGEVVEITSSNFAKYLVSSNRETRKNVYLIVNEQFRKSSSEFANILDSIFDCRIKNAELEKYNSVLEKVLFEENIDSGIIDCLIKAVNDNLELIQKYFKIKASLLGIDDPHLYDLGAPLNDNLKIKYSFEEGIDIVRKALEPLGEEYLEVVDKLLDGHIDASLDDNKHQSITFSWHTYAFMNFRGTYNDLRNMAHEIGHIVNYYLSKKRLPFIYEDSTIFVGETASQINEILLNAYLYKNAKTEEEKIFYLIKEIEFYFTSIFKQTMYTEFENDLYNLKKTKELNSELLSERYDKIIKKYYGNDIVYDDVSSIEWTRLGHLYRWSYYPYKYATGLIMASVAVNSLINDNTLSKEEYIEFLSSGSCMYSLELLKLLNIDLLNNDIIENGFKTLETDIEELNKLVLNKQNN